MKTYSQIGQDLFVVAQSCHKRGGAFVDIGAGCPRLISNTYLLEHYYDWHGLAFDIEPLADPDGSTWPTLRPRTVLYKEDVMKADLAEIFRANGLPPVIDYLSLDLEPPYLTLRCLLEKVPFDRYRFRWVTFETDAYRPGGLDRQLASRKFMASQGYRLVGSVNFQDDYWESLTADEHQ